MLIGWLNNRNISLVLNCEVQIVTGGGLAQNYTFGHKKLAFGISIFHTSDIMFLQ